MVGRHSDVDVLECTNVFDGYLKVHNYRLRHKLFSGGWSSEISREVMERAHVVAVLPYDPQEDSVVLIEQFRPGMFHDGHDPWSVEVVAGLIEKNETAEEVARREMLEEAGLEISSLHRIGGLYSSPGVYSEHVTMFVAHVSSRNAGGIYGIDQEHEDIRAFTCSFAEAAAMLEDGRIQVSHTVAALQWLALHKEEMCDRWA